MIRSAASSRGGDHVRKSRRIPASRRPAACNVVIRSKIRRQAIASRRARGSVDYALPPTGRRLNSLRARRRAEALRLCPRLRRGEPLGGTQACERLGPPFLFQILSELFDFSDHATHIIVTLHGETSERQPIRIFRWQFYLPPTPAYPYERDHSPVATSPGDVHELAVLRNSAGESVWTIDEARCSCSRSSVTNSAANNAAEAKKMESAPRSLCCAPKAAA